MDEPKEPSRGRRGASESERPDSSPLSAFLDAHAAPGRVLSYHQACGFLFTVAAAPDLVPPSAWVPAILGEEEPPFATQEQARRLFGDLMALYNEIVDQTNRLAPHLPEDCRFRDDMLSNFQDDAPVSQWSYGFLSGHTWLGDCWKGNVPPEMESELGAFMMTLSFFSSRRLAERFLAEYPGDAPPLEAMAADCRDVFPEAMTGYAQIGRAIGRASIPGRQAPRRNDARVRRNDPCPCGSGKKYKKCCLGEATARGPRE